MLAHKAEEEGVFVAEIIAGENLTSITEIFQVCFIPGLKPQE